MKILITGTSSGIGHFLAENLAKTQKITGISRQKNLIPDISFFCWDIRKNDFLEKVVSSLDSMNYIIINAGVGYFWEFENIAENQHQEMLETNLLSPISFLHKLLKQKKIKTWIIFIGSIASKKSMKFWASYMASKFWLRGFAMGLKNDYKKLQIQIINPSIVKTNFHKKSTLDMSNYRENSLEEILKIVEDIISWKEKRFEVDV